MNLNESIIKIRVELQKSKIKKSGKNGYAGFEYYELADFLPNLNELMLAEKVNDVFTIEEDHAKLILIKGEEKQEYKMPFRIFEVPLTKDGKLSMQEIQYLGALNTYYKRYLYLNAFGITDGEVIDGMDPEEIKKPAKDPKKTTVKKEIMIQKEQIEIINSLYTEEELKQLLPKVQKTKVEELTLVEASHLIKRKETKDE